MRMLPAELLKEVLENYTYVLGLRSNFCSKNLFPISRLHECFIPLNRHDPPKKALLSNYMVTSSYACKEYESLELCLSLMHATDML